VLSVAPPVGPLEGYRCYIIVYGDFHHYHCVLFSTKTNLYVTQMIIEASDCCQRKKIRKGMSNTFPDSTHICFGILWQQTKY